MKLDFFDSNCQIGRSGVPLDGAPTNPVEVMERVKPVGISRALVYSALAKELHPCEGNSKLLQEIKGFPFIGCWVALPTSTGEIGTPRQFVEEMRKHGIGAVRLFPNLHSYCIQPWCIGPLFEVLEANNVPVFVEVAQTSFDHIAAALADFPKLRLILLRPAYRLDRYLYPLMERYENLCVDTSNYVASGGIEAVCSRFGSRRLIFGTDLPHFEPGAAVSSITYADISDAEKQAIAGGNLENLLAWLGDAGA